MTRKTTFLERAAIAATPYDRVRRFLAETIWNVDPSTLPRFYLRWGLLLLRVIYLVGRGLVSSRTQLRASALTYTTMLALVPAFAVVFSLFQGFGGLEGTDNRVKSFLIKGLAPSAEQEAQIRENLDKLVSNAHDYVRSGSGLAAVSLIFLVLTVVSLLSTVEQTMNEVWGVKRSRSFLQKFMTYWALATLGPILLGLGLVMGSNLNVWLGNYAPARLVRKVWKADDKPLATVDLNKDLSQGTFHKRTEIMMGQLDPSWTPDAKMRFIVFGVYPEEDESSRLSSFMMVAVAFSLLYAFMPNTRVRLRPAVYGGFGAAFAWQCSRWLLANASSSLVQYNTIYGGLATIPIMMFWLYISWLIVIIGAELTFAIQNIGSQGKEELADEASPRCREIVALRVVAAIADAFERGAEPPSLTTLAKRLGAPVALTSGIIFHLCEDGLLREIEQKEDPGYVPAKPLGRISLQDVVSSLHDRGGVNFKLEGGSDASFIAEAIGKARIAHETVAGEITLDRVVAALRLDGSLAPDPQSRARVEDVGQPRGLSGTATLTAPGPTPSPASGPVPVLAGLNAPTVAVSVPLVPRTAPMAALSIPQVSMPQGTEARALALKFAALKAAEAQKAEAQKAAGAATSSEPVGAGESEQLAALLGGADDPV